MAGRAACKYDWQPVNGKYKVPDLSGIGQEPAEETLAHCEIVRIDQYRPYMKPVAGFSSSGNGDLRTIEMAARKAMEFVRYATGLRREEARLSQLTIGLKCGESDTTSGFASNPAVGVVTERLTSSGATIMFGETPELTGAEQVLVNSFEKMSSGRNS